MVAIALFVPFFAPQAEAATMLKVAQESKPGLGDFDSNILGFIEAFGTIKTAANYYHYSKGYIASFNNPALSLTVKQSHLFFVDAIDGLSLFIVHSKPGNLTGGAAKMSFNLLGDTAELKIVDDLGEATANSTGTVFTSNQGWGSCCTDGLAIGSLDNNWEMSVQFTAPPKELNSWQVYSSSTSSKISLSMQTGRRVKLKATPVSTPEPSSMTSLVFAGLALAVRRRVQGGIL
ncbi:hypothetical protein [Coleofasciculus sp. FACHB-1120]|uniref:hypothetical protein n=1 Tax=Coleofasciculus sp. FACHB-1120 TaxID=2692783 RepID=UPI0016869ED7|nr:hypothetical protein [Coleofasciculus sp. FACHB-1120]MBD2742599.1 hypothetical protein [Coleofasciculus sp. FACHB-1120]